MASALLIASARAVPPVIAPIIIGALRRWLQNDVVISIAAMSSSGKAQCLKLIRSNEFLPSEFVSGSSAKSICASFRDEARIDLVVILNGPFFQFEKTRQQVSYVARLMPQGQ